MKCEQAVNLVLCVRRESCGKQHSADTALGEIELSGSKINCLTKKESGLKLMYKRRLSGTHRLKRSRGKQQT